MDSFPSSSLPIPLPSSLHTYTCTLTSSSSPPQTFTCSLFPLLSSPLPSPPLPTFPPTPLLPPGGYLFLHTSSTTSYIPSKTIVLIAYAEATPSTPSRIWSQIQFEESEDCLELTLEGPEIKNVYDTLVELSDVTPEDEVGGGGGDDAFMNFCKAVEGGQTGFIGGEEGQFDD
ncbi:hypothetical protein TrVE_jg7631 [Triparma verrucosa]|uniref:Uncharacterized protein n=1 Tax=Triparma verrucosa TaxID=1606542 RepID=A0A9W7C2S4_9STRA|nr:hypothetical protein TrVE_jg7631 [Triparma verrucosa]